MGTWARERVCRISLEHREILTEVTNKLNNIISQTINASDLLPQITATLGGVREDMKNDVVRQMRKIDLSIFDMTTKFIELIQFLGKKATVGLIIQAFEGRNWTAGVDSILAINWDEIDGIAKLLNSPEIEVVSPIQIKPQTSANIPNTVAVGNPTNKANIPPSEGIVKASELAEVLASDTQVIDDLGLFFEAVFPDVRAHEYQQKVGISFSLGCKKIITDVVKSWVSKTGNGATVQSLIDKCDLNKYSYVRDNLRSKGWSNSVVKP